MRPAIVAKKNKSQRSTRRGLGSYPNPQMIRQQQALAAMEQQPVLARPGPPAALYRTELQDTYSGPEMPARSLTMKPSATWQKKIKGSAPKRAREDSSNSQRQQQQPHVLVAQQQAMLMQLQTAFVPSVPPTTIVHPVPTAAFVHPVPPAAFVHPVPPVAIARPEMQAASARPEMQAASARPEPSAYGRPEPALLVCPKIPVAFAHTKPPVAMPPDLIARPEVPMPVTFAGPIMPAGFARLEIPAAFARSESPAATSSPKPPA